MNPLVLIGICFAAFGVISLVVGLVALGAILYRSIWGREEDRETSRRYEDPSNAEQSPWGPFAAGTGVGVFFLLLSLLFFSLANPTYFRH